MKTRYLILLAVSLLVTSCDPAQDSTQTFATSIVASNYFPTSQGDQYTYQETWRDGTSEIFTDTVTYDVAPKLVRDGISYSPFLPALDTIYTHDGPVRRLLDTLYYRTDSSTIYHVQGSQDRPYVDLGHPFRSGSIVAFPLRFMDSIPIVKVGHIQFDDCVHARGGNDGMTIATFAKNVGLIHLEETGRELILIKARVNGRTIP
jgi:hypothetical protein